MPMSSDFAITTGAPLGTCQQCLADSLSSQRVLRVLIPIDAHRNSCIIPYSSYLYLASPLSQPASTIVRMSNRFFALSYFAYAWRIHYPARSNGAFKLVERYTMHAKTMKGKIRGPAHYNHGPETERKVLFLLCLEAVLDASDPKIYLSRFTYKTTQAPTGLPNLAKLQKKKMMLSNQTRGRGEKRRGNIHSIYCEEI